jgi:peptidoglycan/xylan/chitin deacetylase (PgdA/CDA1 family)
MNSLKPDRAIVLMYHQIISDDATENWVPNDLADPRYGVREGEFSKHLSLFSRMGLPVVDLDSFLSGKSSVGSSNPLSVIITFDDGYESDLSMAAKALVKESLPAIFFLSTDRLGMPGMMTQDQAKELSSLPGLTIGAHGATHRFLTDLSETELKDELDKAKRSLHQLTGDQHFYLSAPGGRVNRSVTKAVSETGYRGLLTSNPGVYIRERDPFCIPRLPVLHGTTIKRLQSLLDPDSFSFHLNGLTRSARRIVRETILSSNWNEKKK